MLNQFIQQDIIYTLYIVIKSLLLFFIFEANSLSLILDIYISLTSGVDILIFSQDLYNIIYRRKLPRIPPLLERVDRLVILTLLLNSYNYSNNFSKSLVQILRIIFEPNINRAFIQSYNNREAVRIYRGLIIYSSCQDIEILISQVRVSRCFS